MKQKGGKHDWDLCTLKLAMVTAIGVSPLRGTTMKVVSGEGSSCENTEIENMLFFQQNKKERARQSNRGNKQVNCNAIAKQSLNRQLRNKALTGEREKKKHPD
jgi:hypothetical protein